MNCKFDISWVGTCKNPATDTGFCEEHSKVKCSVDGKQATHDCDHTGQFVCGSPLCDGCEGYVEQDKPAGVWGFLNHKHRVKAI